MLMRGQTYKVFLDLEMPPSPTNEKLGESISMSLIYVYIVLLHLSCSDLHNSEVILQNVNLLNEYF